LRDFQKAKNLQLTGELNEQTLDALAIRVDAEKQVKDQF
jgi:hypothetical protein